MMDIIGEETIIAQGAQDKISLHQTPLKNTRPILVYAEGRATREHILKRFTAYFIKLDMCFHILNLVSERNLQNQRTLVKV